MLEYVIRIKHSTMIQTIYVNYPLYHNYCVGNHSKHGKCGSAPTWKSQWGARLAGRTHVHG